MLAANDKKADVRTSVHAGHVNHTNVRMNVAIDQTDDLLTDLRRNPEKYEVQ
jgi:O-acetylhomoserine/O-acetylserine sulfhydrylase-like pyridoxal-dependent enzyme